jgi:hypothetical protein
MRHLHWCWHWFARVRRIAQCSQTEWSSVPLILCRISRRDRATPICLCTDQEHTRGTTGRGIFLRRNGDQSVDCATLQIQPAAGRHQASSGATRGCIRSGTAFSAHAARTGWPHNCSLLRGTVSFCWWYKAPECRSPRGPIVVLCSLPVGTEHRWCAHRFLPCGASARDLHLEA